ncbi:MAG: NfeD family protein [Spirosomaceae bacterium]|jgi:hypothetical protein|nr:NfeD family protein [Spirosomataceae bacterium]
MELSATHIWIIVGAAMLIAELLTVSFVSLFFSIGGFITAILSWMGVLPTFNSQLLCFSVVSVVSLMLLRKPLKKLTRKNATSPEYSEYIGDKASVIEVIPPNGEGKVFYRGTEWIAISRHKGEIPTGKSVIIKSLDGIKLLVEEA